MQGDAPRPTRRTVITTTAAGLVVGGFLAIDDGPTATARAETRPLAPDHLTVANDGGTLSTLEITPAATVSWTNFDPPPESVTLTIGTVRIDYGQSGAWDVDTALNHQSNFAGIDQSDANGLTYQFDQPVDLLAETPATASDFEPSDAGGERVSDIEVGVDATVTGTNDTASDGATFTLSLTVDDTGAVLEGDFSLNPSAS